MSQHANGKRIAQKTKNKTPRVSRAFKPAIVVPIAAVALVVILFGVLCAIASARTSIFPNTRVAGVDVGGLNEEEAVIRIEEALKERYAGQEMLVQFPDFNYEKALSLSEVGASIDTVAAVQEAYGRGREGGPLSAGLALIGSLFGGADVPTEFVLQDDSYINTFLEEAAKEIDNPMVEHSYEVSGDNLVVTVGHAGNGLNQETIADEILKRLEAEDYSTLVCHSSVVSPPDLDWDAVYNEIYVAPADAKLDSSSYKVVDHVRGVSFDKEAAKSAVAAAGEDEVVNIPLIYTDPEITTAKLNATLFKDVLGTCTTNVGGSNNRASNVQLAASFCNGTILMPGQVFSYNGVVGSRQASRGFKPAPAYVGGETVNEVGGGICQVSSTIYLASLRANMTIVERYPHSYVVGYVPDGMDATVYYGSLDFKFENNTNNPIKLVCTMEGRTLTVQILGTNEDNITVKMTNKVLSTNPYQTVYEEDASIPAGSSKVKTTGYTGKTVETYRSVYDANGNLISSKVEAVSRYKTRNKVILVPKTSDVETGSVTTPSPSVTPSESPSPTPTPTPTSTPTPTPTQTPTPTPTQTPTPTPTPSPVISAPQENSNPSEEAA